jgi:DNA-directed RNA polymerase II subunit RPB2
MTVGTLQEALTAKLQALKGETTDGTFFRPIDMKAIGDELEAHGYNRNGRERLYNGMTGKSIDTLIFICPIFYQRLAKMVNDSVRALSHGSQDMLTRQPLGGRASNGGSRLGEMEKDCMSANGLARFISEKIRSHSDEFVVYICRGCGGYSTVNHERGMYKCKTCGDNADITEIITKNAAKLFIQELRTMNVGATPKLQPFEYHRVD